MAFYCTKPSVCIFSLTHKFTKPKCVVSQVLHEPITSSRQHQEEEEVEERKVSKIHLSSISHLLFLPF